jgi:hypothetical protein
MQFPRLAALAVLAAALACHPTPKPTPPATDSTAIPADSTSADTGLADTTDAAAPAPEPEVTPADTLPAPRDARRAVLPLTGLPLGLSGYPMDKWGRLPFTGGNITSAPEYMGAVLRRAREAGYRVTLVVPRRFLTKNHAQKGLWSESDVQRTNSLIASKVTNDTLKKYAALGILTGMIEGDDMDDPGSWGGQKVTPAQIEAAYCDMRSKLPSPALILRVIPAWALQRPSMSRCIDAFVVQYRTKFGDQAAYYAKADADAAKLPYKPRLIKGLNFSDCSVVGGPTCTADQLARFGEKAIDEQNSCSANFWNYQGDWNAGGRGPVWDRLSLRARARTNVPSCKRA